ncbi:MAG: immune inhibitor A [Bacteroidetes bacterium]|nr:immune inhibitor A [Bacteroidota bacterium]
MKSLLFLLCLSYSICLFGQQPKYSRARIHIDDNSKSLKHLAELGVTVDHGEHKKNAYYISDFSETELAIARQNGYTVDILIDDVSTYYADQNKTNANKTQQNTSVACPSNVAPITTPANFQLGSMGGYYTYQEMLNILDTMVSKFPNLVTARMPIDTFHSIEHRPIWWLKISDNPNSNEPEPQIIYTALHHAREPASLSQMIYYMYYLLENYNSNPDIKALIDNTEMYFVPCVNPDGYIYNQTTNPGGGGMWRKNRRNNGDGTMGVDLNRNYGFHWAYDNVGSSPTTSSDTYRGASAFSEPEIQAIQWFDTQHQFRISVNYHTYGNDLIYPWGYIANLYTPDSAVFVNHTHLMTSLNHFVTGTGNQTVQYVTNGDSDDWGYGEQSTKNKILSMTPEIGTSFWPPQSDITGICENSLWQNIYAAKLVGKYALVKDEKPYAFNSQSGYLNYSIQRLGLDSPSVFTVSVIPLDSWISSVGSPKVYNNMSLLQLKHDSISYTLNPAITNGQQFRYVLRVNNGYGDENDTITKVFGQSNTVYTNNGSAVSGFTSSGAAWGISTQQYVSPPSSITDSPGGNYANNTNSRLTLNTPVDLSNASHATLNFWAKWNLEPGYDYVEVQASVNGANAWTPLCGHYTHAGTVDQDQDNPLYDGIQNNWVWEEMDLGAYLGQMINIRYVLVSDQGVNYDGFYFDDMSVNILQGPNAAGIQNYDQSVNYVSQNIPNPAHTITYINYNLAGKKDLSLCVYNTIGEMIQQSCVESSQGQVSIDLSNLSNGTYFYQVIAADGYHSTMMKMVVMK